MSDETTAVWKCRMGSPLWLEIVYDGLPGTSVRTEAGEPGGIKVFWAPQWRRAALCRGRSPS